MAFPGWLLQNYNFCLELPNNGGVIRGEIEQRGGNVDFRRKVVDDFDGEMVVGLAEEMVGK